MALTPSRWVDAKHGLVPAVLSDERGAVQGGKLVSSHGAVVCGGNIIVAGAFSF
jgi:hypothetical protein